MKKHLFIWIPITLMVLSAVAKVYGLLQDPENLPNPNMADNLGLILYIELICIAAIMIQRTRAIGFLLMCSYLGGAIAVDLLYTTTSPIVPAIILSLFWISVYLIQPTFFFLRINDKPKGSKDKVELN